MSRFTAILLLLVVSWSVSVHAADNGLSEARTEFLAGNPNGDWTFGFINDDDVFVPFNTTFKVGDDIVGWALDGCPGIFGDVTLSSAQQPIEKFGVRWESGQLCINTGVEGRGVGVCWTSSHAGLVEVRARLTGQSSVGTDVSVNLLKNRASLSEQPVRGFMGERASTRGRMGTQPEAELRLKIEVSKGDALGLFVATPRKDEQAGGHVGLELSIDTLTAAGSVISSTSPLRHMAKREGEPEVVAKVEEASK